MSPLAIAGCCSSCNTNTVPSLRLKINTTPSLHGRCWNKGCAPLQPLRRPHEQHSAREHGPGSAPRPGEQRGRRRRPCPEGCRSPAQGPGSAQQSRPPPAPRQTPPQNATSLSPCTRARGRARLRLRAPSRQQPHLWAPSALITVERSRPSLAVTWVMY